MWLWVLVLVLECSCNWCFERTLHWEVMHVEPSLRLVCSVEITHGRSVTHEVVSKCNESNDSVFLLSRWMHGWVKRKW